MTPTLSHTPVEDKRVNALVQDFGLGGGQPVGMQASPSKNSITPPMRMKSRAVNTGCYRAEVGTGMKGIGAPEVL